MKLNYTHILFWLAYLILYIWFFYEGGPFGGAILPSLSNVSIQAAIFYGNAFFLMPKFFEQKRYFFYAIGVFGLCLVGALLFEFLFSFDLPIEELAEFGGEEFPPLYSFESLSFSAIPFFVAWIFSMLYRILEINRLREQEQSLRIEAESKFLKSQMNPHFLFNALNNIYSMSIVEVEKTPNAIYQLSELLRYVVYDSAKEKVFLNKEIKYLKSFIELCQLKNKDHQNIKCQFKSYDTNLRIAPMLLMPFIENSFKHSNVEDDEKGWIELELFTEAGILHFFIKNSIPATQKSKDKQQGIGLENVQKRLKLLYLDKYDLEIIENKKSFEVELKIDLS